MAVELSDETKLNERRAIMQTRVISWRGKSGKWKWKMGKSGSKCYGETVSVFSSYLLFILYVLLRFYASIFFFFFEKRKQCQKLAKSCGRLSAQMRILCLPQKVATERKLRHRRKKRMKILLPFSAAGIITNDATVPLFFLLPQHKELP